ncbi:exodeoxyribonuclease VII large subunit [Vulcanibacillus modesticaldus]|uniref:Exodeoxyribonuclease 7 large subunit n=1 Tax=Vulcanibacillus modesticaldus TaxID=337097 RepID=A0A1D2YRT2_9BACI|nr:exodeoxyribonuclease VII large subunit [Vulcanibacillus modesticaldus]OEF95522.1 exodeoxyribonuclease VII large subunit [Vulcanibacillus modesticaldus]
MGERGKIFSIIELTSYIKSVLDDDSVLANIWVRGEISNFTHHSSGHMYFTLKDESSRLRAIMFAGNNRFLKFIPKNGTKVLARGYISIYERDGQYQFYVQEMQPDGIGQLYLAFEQLKQKLEAEGLFAQEKKKALPSFPQTIGIITSSTGAAIRDMITTIKRRYPLINLLIFPVLVQGKDAAKSIADAIEQMNNYEGVDLLIVGRGGGSIEELWAFNEEIVARSIYQSQIPVISAVGHETDFTIADFVADVRAATPTAAAELAVPNIEELKNRITYFENRLEGQFYKTLEEAKSSLMKLLNSIVFRRPKQYLLENSQRLDHLETRLHHSLANNTSIHREKLLIVYHKLLQEKPEQKLANQKERLNHLTKQLIREIGVIKEIYQKNLDIKLGQLDALSPLKVMQRGYAIAYDESEKKLLKSIKDVQPGDLIKVHLYDGKLDCQVWGLEDKKNG